MEIGVRGEKEVAWWLNTYLPFNMQYYAIAPFGKNVYTDVDVWENFRYGGNIALDTLRSKKIGLDIDSKRLSPEMAKVMKQTLSFSTPKGYCAILDGDISEPYRAALYAYHLNCSGNWKRIETEKLNDDLDVGLRISKFLAKLGLKDATAVHAGFPNTDDKTYVLLPPSATCRWSGYKSTVRSHSTYSEICNQSPTGKHNFKQRVFYHFTTDLLNWDNFCGIVGLRAK